MSDLHTNNRIRIGSAPEQAGEGLSLLHILDITRRRWPWAVVPAILCTAAFATVAYLLPPTYTSEVTVAAESLADTDQTLRPVAVDVQTHLATIREIIHRRSLLDQINTELGLYRAGAAGIPQESLDQLRSTIAIRVEGEETFKIGYTSTSPELAKNVASRLAELFIADIVAARRTQADAVTGVLDAQIDALGRQLDEQQQRIEDYRQQAGGDLPLNFVAQESELRRLRDDLTRKNDAIRDSEAERAQIVSELDILKELGAVNPGVDLAELEDELAALQSRYTDNHPNVLRKKREIAAAEAAGTAPGFGSSRGEYASEPQIRYIRLVARLDFVDQTLAALRRDRQTINADIAATRRQLDVIPAQETEMTDLQRAYDMTKAQHASLLQTQYNTQLSGQLTQSNSGLTFRLVEPARLPLEPSGPPRLRLALLGLAAGICLAAAAVFVVEQTDASFADVEELRGYTDLPILASIPSIKRAGNNGTRSKLVTLLDPSAVATEQYRVLAMRARQSLDADGSKVLLVTSSAGGEGKTTTSINLAVALTEQTNGSVLLMDCDLRWPRVHQALSETLKGGFNNGKGGFAELLQNPDENPLRYATRVGRLYVIADTDGTNASFQALVSAAAPKLLQQLRERFEYIVLDAPPIVPMADSHVLATLADQALLVVRARHTRRELLERAAETFDLSKVPGVVLNDVNYGRSRYAYAYDYYSNHYADSRRAKRQAQG